MPRYKLTIEYDGTPTVGWQKQVQRSSSEAVAHTTKHLSVQGALEDAVFAMSGERVEVIGAGRTDSGVHATAQAAHMELSKEWDLHKLMHGINHHMWEQIAIEPCPISVIAIEPVSDEFHARFSATRRYYTYLILNRSARPALDTNRVWHVPEALDVEKMQQAANLLIGHHDFTSFRDSKCQAKSPVKTLDAIEFTRAGEMISMHVHAKSFLHHMVRNIIGTLWMVGTGRIEPEEVTKILAARDRTQAGPTAPASGLYLIKVDY